MLVAGWEVRKGKNSDRGLENANIFKPEVTVFPYMRTDPKAANNIFTFLLPAVN